MKCMESLSEFSVLICIIRTAHAFIISVSFSCWTWNSQFFALCFWGNLGLLTFISINCNNKFCLCRNSFEAESMSCYSEIGSIVKFEELYVKSNWLLFLHGKEMVSCPKIDELYSKGGNFSNNQRFEETKLFDISINNSILKKLLE